MKHMRRLRIEKQEKGKERKQRMERVEEYEAASTRILTHCDDHTRHCANKKHRE